MKTKKILFLLLFVFFIGCGCGFFKKLSFDKTYYTALNDNITIEENQQNSQISPRLIFYGIKQIIDRNYVEKIDDKLYNDMSVNLVKGMLRELGDQNCRYVDKEEMALLSDAEEGKFEGVGIRCDIKAENINGINEEQLFVANVIPGSSAYKAGLKSGEKILKINNKEILPYNSFGRAEKILNEYQKKPDRSKLKEIQKKIENEYDRIEKALPILEAEKMISFCNDKSIIIQTDVRTYNLKSAKFTIETVKHDIYKNVDYLEIQYFGKDTGRKLGEYISDFNKNKKKYFVLDLRDLFGGTYENTAETAKFFIPKSRLGKLKTNSSEIDLTVPESSIVWKGKLIVLVNKGTCKYGELLANALAKNNDTVLVGEETGGDLSDISVYDLENGGGFTLTTGKYIPLNNINKAVPDIKTKLGSKGSEVDMSVISKALNIKKGVKK